ncbi:Rha family transcriptional regulator [Gordonia sputi]
MPVNDISPLAAPGENGPETTSLIVADGTGVEHASVIKLIRNNLSDFEEFGLVRFQIRPRPQGQHGGADVEFAVLNEEQATLLLTYMRNSNVVRQFKKNLVRAFHELRARKQRPLEGPELLAAAVLESQKVIEQREARIFQLEQTITANSSKVSYVDTYVTDADLLSFSTVASSCNVTEKALRELLIERDWIYSQQDSRWSEKKQQKVIRNRYSEKADKKRYFRRVENHEAPRFRGSEVMHTLKITPQGAEAIARLVERAA